MPSRESRRKTDSGILESRSVVVFQIDRGRSLDIDSVRFVNSKSPPYDITTVYLLQPDTDSQILIQIRAIAGSGIYPVSLFIIPDSVKIHRLSVPPIPIDDLRSFSRLVAGDIGRSIHTSAMIPLPAQIDEQSS